MTLNISEILGDLSLHRPLFQIEADFQHSLGWEIQKQNLNCSIRFEFKPKNVVNKIFVDLWIKDESDLVYAIELKYKTRKLNVLLDDESYELLTHDAQNLGRYDFLKDVQRLENIISKNHNVKGFAIFLTNDHSYWKIPTGRQTIDENFRIHEGKTIHGELSWLKGASEGSTTEERKSPGSDYLLSYNKFSDSQMKHIILHFDMMNRMNFLTALLFQVEVFLKSINYILENNLKTKSYQLLVKHVLKELKITNREKKYHILYIPMLVRNSLHSGGIHMDDNDNGRINGILFKFKKGEILHYTSWYHEYFFSDKIIDVIEEIMNLPKLKGVNLPSRKEGIS
ncbi:MAG: hypothetical protein YK1309IOTA_1960003 [Marine Group I thaumarchaeote]|nr:MAG: hypothetical protein YK1309IOTA_1960003 [Marine Group I thaumarchaeote]